MASQNTATPRTPSQCEVQRKVSRSPGQGVLPESRNIPMFSQTAHRQLGKSDQLASHLHQIILLLSDGQCSQWTPRDDAMTFRELCISFTNEEHSKRSWT